MSKKIIDWSEVLQKDSDSEETAGSPSLIESRPASKASPTNATQGACVEHKVALQFTLNYPRTVKFLNANSSEQKKIYAKILHNVKNFNGFIPDEVLYVYEHCASGQIHMHCNLTYTIRQNFCINGLVSDFTKSVLSQLPLKYSQYKEGALNIEWNRYRDKGLCVQYFPASHDRVKFFSETYMSKENTPQILK